MNLNTRLYIPPVKRRKEVRTDSVNPKNPAAWSAGSSLSLRHAGTVAACLTLLEESSAVLNRPQTIFT